MGMLPSQAPIMMPVPITCPFEIRRQAGIQPFARQDQIAALDGGRKVPRIGQVGRPQGHRTQQQDEAKGKYFHGRKYMSALPEGGGRYPCGPGRDG
jgi:hypothetical protein